MIRIRYNSFVLKHARNRKKWREICRISEIWSFQTVCTRSLWGLQSIRSIFCVLSSWPTMPCICFWQMPTSYCLNRSDLAKPYTLPDLTNVGLSLMKSKPPKSPPSVGSNPIYLKAEVIYKLNWTCVKYVIHDKSSGIWVQNLYLTKPQMPWIPFKTHSI